MVEIVPDTNSDTAVMGLQQHTALVYCVVDGMKGVVDLDLSRYIILCWTCL